MTAPRRNVELKATDPDPAWSLAACRALGADDHGLIVQRDTYFSVPHGGLKLREETPGAGWSPSGGGCCCGATSASTSTRSRASAPSSNSRPSRRPARIEHEHRLVGELRKTLGITHDRLRATGYAALLLG